MIKDRMLCITADNALYYYCRGHGFKHGLVGIQYTCMIIRYSAVGSSTRTERERNNVVPDKA